MSAPLALLAFVLALRRARHFAVVVLPLVCNAAGLALTIFDPRYRLVSDPLVAVLLAALLTDVVLGTGALGPRSSRGVKLVLAGLVVAASVVVHAAHWDATWYCVPRTSATSAASAPRRRR